MSPCPRPGCNGVVSLRVSRGTSHPENRGCSYEACGIPGMQESHFIRWRHDIPRHNIPSPSKIPLALGASLHDLLQIPLTPRSVLPFQSGGSSQPHTPTRKPSTSQHSAQAETPSRALNTRTPPMPPNHVPDSEDINNRIDQLQLENDTVGVTNLLHALEQAQSAAEPQTLDISHPASGIEQPVNETNDSNISSHTQIVMTKQGQAEERCNGPNCQTSKRQVPAKHAQTCTHRYCKKCCLEFQSQGARKCSLTSHKLKGSESVLAVDKALESENATSSAPTATSGQFQRPLREDHYLAQLNASQKWGVTSGTLIEKRVAEESLKKTLDALYWKNDVDPPQPLTLTCPTFPVFSISSCTPAMQKLLDCTSDDEDTTSSAHAKWPLKFVQPMANGFKEMDTMKGSVPERFTSVFRLPFPGSKATYYSARNAWDAATDAQKDEYIDAGLSSSGLWKDFVKEVTTSHGGTIPKKRLARAAGNSGRRAIYHKDKDLVSVKKEEETNTTFSSEIICIDD